MNVLLILYCACTVNVYKAIKRLATFSFKNKTDGRELNCLAFGMSALRIENVLGEWLLACMIVWLDMCICVCMYLF